MAAMALRQPSNVDARVIYRMTREVVRSMVNAQMIPQERAELEYQKHLAANLRKHGLPVPRWVISSTRITAITAM